MFACVQYAIILIVLLLAEIALIIFAALYGDAVRKLIVFINLYNTHTLCIEVVLQYHWRALHLGHYVFVFVTK